jgi:SAM-dependent methyltransferase
MSVWQRWIGWARWTMRQKDLRGVSPARALVHPFDREHGLETSGLIHGWRIGVGHRHAAFSTAYLGVPPSRMRAVLERWRSSSGGMPTEACAFVDVGCGKGRALLLASEMPFREVLGVELDGDLLTMAQRNVARWQLAGRPRSPVTAVDADGTEVELPDGALLVYLFNPFGAPVLRRMLQRLQHRQTAVDVLYLYPKYEAVFAEFPAFKLLWKEGVGLTAEDVGPMASQARWISVAPIGFGVKRWWVGGAGPRRGAPGRGTGAGRAYSRGRVRRGAADECRARAGCPCA